MAQSFGMTTHRLTHRASGLSLLAAAGIVFTIGMGAALITTASPNEPQSNAAEKLFHTVWAMDPDGQDAACEKFLNKTDQSIAAWRDLGFNQAGVNDMLRFGYAHCTVSV